MGDSLSELDARSIARTIMGLPDDLLLRFDVAVFVEQRSWTPALALCVNEKLRRERA